jgi:hypothetical protein
MNGYIVISDQALRQWLDTATPVDVETALNVGWKNVEYVKSVVKSRAPSTVVIGNLQQSEVPVHRGQVGEELIESILRERFNDITNMTKVPKSGDITLWIAGRKTIVEVKNYSNPVPTTGVEKFRRDLSTAGAFSGVFISLQSPISGITTDFKIHLEAVDGRTVPCAYIVSSDRSHIITSISMVIHLASSLIGVSRDAYSRDHLLGVVRDMSGHIDELAGTRHNMQKELADASERAMKNSSNIMSTEVKLRSDVEKLQGELCEAIVFGADDRNICANITGYEKLGAEMKICIGTVIRAIQNQPGPDLAQTWKVLAKKCIHVQSGCALLFSAKKVQVSIPVGKMSVDTIGQLITRIGSKYSWLDGAHTIDICDETIKNICDVIDGTFH